MSSYSINQNFAFIHIPKNAGSSVRKALGQAVPDLHDFAEIDRAHRTVRHPALSNHYPVWYLQRMLTQYGYPVLREQFNVMRKFMVVRNPWERMVSLYFHRMRKLRLWHEGKPRNTPADIEAAEKGFEYWLMNTPSEMDKILTTMPQTSWGEDVNNEFVVKWIRFEELQDGYKVMSSLLDIPYVELPHVLKGQGHATRYREHYKSQEAIDHVAHYFRTDIERFSYAF